jgi:N-dimethylarginine dimethylaminohydrolase
VTTARQKLLLCPPDFFGVQYVINPWMLGNRGRVDLDLAKQQWIHLKDSLAQHADIELIQPQTGLPDMVFTANAGMVLGKNVIVSRFRFEGRQGEEAFFHSWFEQNGFTIMPWPPEIFFEGAGDALFDRGAPVIWSAYGFRSDEKTARLLEKFFGRKTIGLHLVNPRFYHIDTCLCPLSDGYMLYYPDAFDEAGQSAINAHVPTEKRIPITLEDASQYACNAVELDKHLFLNGASAELQQKLKSLGFTPVVVPLSEFMRAGGAAKCLTLKLIEN